MLHLKPIHAGVMRHNPALMSKAIGSGPMSKPKTGAANGVASESLPPTLMSLTFASRSLQRTFALEDLAALSKTQLGILHAELTKAIEAMDEKMKEVQEQPLDQADSDWLHRVKKKRLICETFTQQVAESLMSADGTFEQIYRFKLEELLLDELGKDTFLEIKGEAMEFALVNRPQAVPAA